MEQYELKQHQKDAINMLRRNNFSGCVWHGTGTGKTVTGISAYLEFKTHVPNAKLLVICPINLIKDAWILDLERFTTLKVCNTRTKLDIKADVFLINYESAYSDKLKKIAETISAIAPTMCILDESHHIKDPKSASSKTIRNLATLFSKRISMSGTPHHNSELDIWAQVDFVRPGFFGKFSQFKNSNFQMQSVYTPKEGMLHSLFKKYIGKVAPEILDAIKNKILSQTIQPEYLYSLYRITPHAQNLIKDIFKVGFRYSMIPSRREYVLNAIKPFTHYAKLSDCMDMPEIIYETRTYELTKEQRKVYNSMKTHLIAEISNSVITTQNALTKIGKLHQICSGGCLDELHIKQIIPGGNPKLELLMDVISDINQDEPIIIWCNYQFENEDIQEALRSEYGDTVVSAYGKTEDVSQSIRDYKSGKARFIVASQQSLGEGQTLTRGYIQIFYSINYSAIKWDQSLGRTLRMTQESPRVLYIILQGKDTREEIAKDVVTGKITQADAVRDFIMNR